MISWCLIVGPMKLLPATLKDFLDSWCVALVIRPMLRSHPIPPQTSAHRSQCEFQKNQIGTYPTHRSMINTHRSRCESKGNHKGAIPMRSHSDISAGVDFFETSMYMPAETLQAWLSVLWNCSLQPWQIPWIQKIQNNHNVDLIFDLTDQSMSKHCMCTLILIVADATEQGKHQWSSMGGSGGEGKVENPAGKG